jgi:DNA repair ATPase RecN
VSSCYTVVMLHRLEIHNFQSLKEVQLEFGLLTVIVGESNSGKSAVGRALKALASNIRGSSCITMGCKMASVSVSSDNFRVTLEKSENSSSYRVSQSDQQDREYTKLAGTTPPEVTQVLGLDSVTDGQSINFAGQHDSPFLLTAPGAAVARQLGDLTSVSTVFEAVREANRRSSVARSTEKLRQQDLAEITAKLVDSEVLRVRATALKQAEISLREIRASETSISELTQFLNAVTALPELFEVPVSVDLTELVTAYELFKQLCVYASRISKGSSAIAVNISSITQSESQYNEAEAAVHDLLKEAGRCPLCQQLVVT